MTHFRSLPEYRRRKPSLDYRPRLTALEDRVLLTWILDSGFTTPTYPNGHAFVADKGRAQALTVQADAKVLLAGRTNLVSDNSDLQLVRLCPNAHLDDGTAAGCGTGFGVGGIVT